MILIGLRSLALLEPIASEKPQTDTKQLNSMTDRTIDARIGYESSITIIDEYMQTHLVAICICFDPSKDRFYFQTQVSFLIFFVTLD